MKNQHAHPKFWTGHGSNNSLGRFLRSRERYIHVSAHIVRNPAAILAEHAKKFFNGPQFVVHRPGTTYWKA